MPLPASGEHDLVLVPKGESVDPGVPGTVSFASGSVIIVQHPTYGRVTLLAGSEPLPKAGDPVLLEGVTVKPGGVVKAERWWVAGARAAREPMRIALVAPKMRVVPSSAPSQLAGDLLVRSSMVGIAVLPELLRLVERADCDALFRDALGRLGFRFGTNFNGADVVEALEIEGFLPVWGDGNGETFGGVTAAGELAYLLVKDDQAVRALPSLFEHLRAEAAESEQKSSAEVVLEALVPRTNRTRLSCWRLLPSRLAWPKESPGLPRPEEIVLDAHVVVDRSRSRGRTRTSSRGKPSSDEPEAALHRAVSSRCFVACATRRARCSRTVTKNHPCVRGARGICVAPFTVRALLMLVA